MKLLFLLSAAAFILLEASTVLAASDTRLNIDVRSLDCTVDFLQDGQNIYQYMDPSICTTRVSPPPIPSPSTLQPTQELVGQPIFESTTISELHADPIAVASIEQSRRSPALVRQALREATITTVISIGESLAVMMLPIIAVFVLLKLIIP